MPGETTVLVVEDDDDLRRFCRQSLVMAGYHVEDVATGYSAVRRLGTVKPDIILFDLLPALGGLSVLHPSPPRPTLATFLCSSSPRPTPRRKR